MHMPTLHTYMQRFTRDSWRLMFLCQAALYLGRLAEQLGLLLPEGTNAPPTLVSNTHEAAMKEVRPNRQLICVPCALAEGIIPGFCDTEFFEPAVAGSAFDCYGVLRPIWSGVATYLRALHGTVMERKERVECGNTPYGESYPDALAWRAVEDRLQNLV